MSRQSLEQYATERGAALMRFAYALTGDRHLAEDLTQAAFEKVAKRWDRLDPYKNIDGYLRKTVARTYLDWTRRRAFTEYVTTPFAQVFTQRGEVAPEPDSDGADLWEALTRLPPKQRCALVLRFYEDRDDQQIAWVMGCRPSTVRSNIARGLATLRASISNEPAANVTEGTLHGS